MDNKIKGFTTNQLQRAINEINSPLGSELFEGLNDIFTMMAGLASKKNGLYREYSDDEARSFVVFAVYKQLHSQHVNGRGLEHIKNPHAYCKTLLNGYLSTYIKGRLSEDRKLNQYKKEHFEIEENERIEKLNDRFNEVEDTLYRRRADPDRLFRVPFKDTNLTLSLGEIANTLNDSDQTPNGWLVFFWVYIMNNTNDFAAMLCKCSPTTIDRRIELIKEKLLNLAEMKYEQQQSIWKRAVS